MTEQIFVSVDVETTGSAPGIHSMLSLGAAAFTVGSPNPIDTFEINYEQLPSATWDPDTREWWAKQDPDVLAYVQKDPVDPREATQRFHDWLVQLPGKPVLLVYPAWDYVWVHWYFVRYEIKNPMGLSALDAKSFAMAAMRNPEFRNTHKGTMPKRWFEDAPEHNHTGLQDAIGQGMMFLRMYHDVFDVERYVAVLDQSNPLNYRADTFKDADDALARVEQQHHYDIGSNRPFGGHAAYALTRSNALPFDQAASAKQHEANKTYDAAYSEYAEAHKKMMNISMNGGSDEDVLAALNEMRTKQRVVKRLKKTVREGYW